MALRTTIEQLVQLGRRITGNVIDITMALLKEASGYSRHVQTLYTFLSGVLPTTEAPQWAGADYSTPTYQPPRVVRPTAASSTSSGASTTRATHATTQERAEKPASDMPKPVDRAASVSAPAKPVEAPKEEVVVAPVEVASTAEAPEVVAPAVIAEAAAPVESASAAESTSPTDELAALTKKELQERCDAAGISYKSKDSKATLIELLQA